ncbi:MAG: hypothetical protein IT345_10820 [Trueperaceae bacterium]|nr:hypothetical protein [Trueperaceae bacterium]
MTPVTWLDVALVLMVVVTTALGAKRRLVGCVVGVGGALLLRPLIIIGLRDLWIALAAGVCGTLILALIGQRLVSAGRRQRWGTTVLGGVGGAVLGLSLMFALVTSLPIERSTTNEREIFYPPRTAPAGLAVTFAQSPLVLEGRAILLHPLLLAPTPAEGLANLTWRAEGLLHRWLVVGEPWTAP